MNPSDMTMDTVTDTSNRLVESFRRLIFIGGILSAVWLIAAPGGFLWRVKDVHFEENQKSEARRMARNLKMMGRESGIPIDPSLNRAANQSLEEYIAAKTEGRLIHVDGADWRTFFGDVEATLSGKSTVYLCGASEHTGSSYLYFLAETKPLQRLTPQVNREHRFSYLDLKENGATRYLEVLCQPPVDARSYAPMSLVYPGRKYAVWFFVAAVLIYALLPWPEYGQRTLNYGRFRSVIVPDILGATLVSFFFLLPVLIVGSNYDGPLIEGLFSTDKGWIWLTGTMWLLAAISLGITFVTLWYSVFWLTLLPQGIRYKTFGGIK